MTDRSLQYDSILKALRVLRKKRDDTHLTTAFLCGARYVFFKSLNTECGKEHFRSQMNQQ